MPLTRFLVVSYCLLTLPALAASDIRAEFSKSLAQGYAEIAKFAVAKLHDQSGESYFQNKSDRAGANYAVDPEWPTNWTLAPSLQQTMAREREELLKTLTRLDKGADPRIEAIAQVNFDCWVALSSIPTLQKDSARCRDAFHAAMQQLGS
jgi:hypothetical protein